MIPKNQTFYKTKLTDLLEFWKDDVMLEMNCHAIGTIQSFNPTLQTATATVNYQKVVYEFNEESQVYGPVLLAYPLLVDCPVHFDFGGAGGTTKPVKKGDECLIAFNDRDFDAWFRGQQNQAPNTARLHFFTDAILFVGIRSTPNAILNFDADRPAIRNFSGDTFVAVGASKIELANSLYTLNGLLQELLTQIQAITVLPGSFSNSGGPVVGVSGTPVNASSIADIATKIGNLLA